MHALQRHQFIVLFPVNPATLAKYREAFVPSRAKDDPTDAQIALELLLWHRDKLQPLQPQSADMRTLATLVEQRRLLVGQDPDHQSAQQHAEGVLPAGTGLARGPGRYCSATSCNGGPALHTPSEHGKQRCAHSSRHTIYAAHHSLRNASTAFDRPLPSPTMRP